MPAREWMIRGRLDQNLGSKDRVFFRVMFDRGLEAENADPISSKFSEISNMPSENGGITWGHVFSGTATNQLIVAADATTKSPLVLTGEQCLPVLLVPVDQWKQRLSSCLIIGCPTTTYGLNRYGYEVPGGRNVPSIR